MKRIVHDNFHSKEQINLSFSEMNPLEGHKYIELPPIPNGPLEDTALQEFSEKLIEAYSSYRFTTSVNHMDIIKRYPIRLCPRDPAENSTDPIRDTDPQVTVTDASPATELAENDAPKPCFLHTRPKTSGCIRCSAYLEWKRSNSIKRQRT
jgi:hypothetical protein